MVGSVALQRSVTVPSPPVEAPSSGASGAGSSWAGGDQHVDPAAQERAADRLELARAAGHADAAIGLAQLLERHAEHAAVDVRLDARALRVEEPQADVADGASLAKLLDLVRREDVPAALQQRR